MRATSASTTTPVSTLSSRGRWMCGSATAQRAVCTPRSTSVSVMRSVIRLAACTLALALVSTPALAQPGGGALTRHQRHVLYGIAADTWRFFGADVDPSTHLP